MKRTIMRAAELILGSAMFVFGVILLFLPGPGTPFVVGGLLLISPYHGRRLVWWLVLIFRWLRAKWHYYYHGRHTKRHKTKHKRRLPWPFSKK